MRRLTYRPYIYMYALALVLCLALLVFYYTIRPTGEPAPVRQPITPTAQPSAISNPSSTPTPVALVIATAVPAPSDEAPILIEVASATPVANSSAITATLQPPAVSQPTPDSTAMYLTASPTQAASSGGAPTAISTTFPAMVAAAAFPLAQSAPGVWQGDPSGVTSYVLPEGAEEGEALGELSASGQATVKVQSGGEDCGLAIGSATDFILLRLRPDGGGGADVLVDHWQGDNFTTPPPSDLLHLSSSPADGWYLMQVSSADSSINYRIGDQSASLSSETQGTAQIYLYAGGSGCRYRPAS